MMHASRLYTAVTLVLLAVVAPLHAELVIDFEDLTPTIAYGTDPVKGHYENGTNLDDGFSSRGVFFQNQHEIVTWQGKNYETWSGWAYSNVVDITTPDFANQFAAFARTAPRGGTNYAVAYGPTAIDLPSAPIGFHVTNTTYTALLMLDGDPNKFARQFSTDNSDWFRLTITGKNLAGDETGSVPFYLADYQTSPGSVVRDWTWVDLTGLGSDTRRLEFALSSTDNGDWGMNTPAYFAMDNLTVVPEPGTALLFVLGAVCMLGACVRRLRG